MPGNERSWRWTTARASLRARAAHVTCEHVERSVQCLQSLCQLFLPVDLIYVFDFQAIYIYMSLLVYRSIIICVKDILFGMNIPLDAFSFVSSGRNTGACILLMEQSGTLTPRGN